MLYRLGYAIIKMIMNKVFNKLKNSSPVIIALTLLTIFLFILSLSLYKEIENLNNKLIEIRKISNNEEDYAEVVEEDTDNEVEEEVNNEGFECNMAHFKNKLLEKDFETGYAEKLIKTGDKRTKTM